MSTHMDPVEKLKPNTRKPVYHLKYSRAIGCLMYAMTSTRLDITYAVGRLSRDDEIEQQFWMEISVLSSLKHKNLVSLVGFCDENDEKIIIIKFETNGCLGNSLSDSRLLTWVRRLEICVDLANALNYIHYDEPRDFSIIHRNIHSWSVLLNDNWQPKLSEFKLSMKIKASQRHLSFDTDNVWYTKGYTDPTYLETRSAHHKSDMYSFGIVMFELLCGRKSVIDDDQDNMYFALMAVAHYRDKKLNEIVDWDLWKQMDSPSFEIFVEIAYDCLNEERSQRPNIDDIVPRLEKALELARENTPSARLYDVIMIIIQGQITGDRGKRPVAGSKGRKPLAGSKG
uniref:Protein kinase-like domain, phloem protein 2-like protein n=1 Tax=Tanacetum cinerariifolium TaxID=118510 RepID=A0A699I402_TANCI|nr:protein kinase-like domain, phloem protein 2-like protein [Tanacetum cinerariifolium]